MEGRSEEARGSGSSEPPSRDHEHPSQARWAREGWSDAGVTMETEGPGGPQTRTLNLRMSMGFRNHFNLQDVSVTFPLLQAADPEVKAVPSGSREDL